MSESTKPLVALQGVSAVVTLGNKDRLTTVNDVSLELFAGMTYSIVGKSGAGKTSLISIIGMLNTQFSGRYLYKGQDVGALSDRRLSFMRAGHIGFVFQNYSLIGHLSALENVEMALWYGQHAPPSPRHGRFRLGPQAQVPCRARFGRSQGQGEGTAEKTLGRRTATGCDRPRPGQPARASHLRRADRSTRHQDQRRGAFGAAGRSARACHDLAARHP